MRLLAVVGLVLLTSAGCKRRSDDASGLANDNAPPAASGGVVWGCAAEGSFGDPNNPLCRNDTSNACNIARGKSLRAFEPGNLITGGSCRAIGNEKKKCEAAGGTWSQSYKEDGPCRASPMPFPRPGGREVEGCSSSYRIGIEGSCSVNVSANIPEMYEGESAALTDSTACATPETTADGVVTKVCVTEYTRGN